MVIARFHSKCAFINYSLKNEQIPSSKHVRLIDDQGCNDARDRRPKRNLKGQYNAPRATERHRSHLLAALNARMGPMRPAGALVACLATEPVRDEASAAMATAPMYDNNYRNNYQLRWRVER